MKKALFLLVLSLLTVSGYAQHSSEKPAMLLRPYLETGVNFIRNDALKEKYGTESVLYFGGGVQLGNPDSVRMIPFIQYLQSRYTIESKTTAADVEEPRLFIRQFMAGFVLPFAISKEVSIRSKIGFSVSKINESFFEVNSQSIGMLIGLGLQKKILRHSSIYVDFSYNYQKASEAGFKDFDTTKLGFGFTF